MADIQDLRDAVSAAQAAYAAAVEGGDAREIESGSADVKSAKLALSSGIAAGANPCPKCKQLPIGMIQPGPRDGLEFFEVGCLCQDHRAIGFLPELAVANWNKDVAAFDPAGDLPAGWLPHRGAVCYLIESDALDESGEIRGVFRFYTPDEAKAKKMAGEVPGRRLIVLRGLDIPADVQRKMDSASAQKEG